MTTKLQDDLYEEIFVLITDWIMTNDIQYSHYHCSKYGYLKQYEEGEEKQWQNYHTIMWVLRFLLGRYNIEAVYERYKKSKFNSGVMVLAVLEDELLMTIHEKMLEWAERHRLRPEFNKAKKGRTRCYRPTQYSNAVHWLWKHYRELLWKWRKKHI